MALYYYIAMLVVSILFVIFYACIFHKHFDVNITIMVVLVPIINLAFLLMGHSTTIEQAITALKFTYIGGCYLLLIVTLCIFNICGINLNSWQKALIITISSGIFLTTLTIGHNDLFYKGMPELAYYGGAAYITNKSYGIMHTVFYAMVIIYYTAMIAAIVISFFRKKQVSRLVIILLSVAVTIALVGYLGGRIITEKIESLPATYNIGMIIWIIIASRLRLYDVSDSVIDSLVQKGDTGFVSFDSKMNYLGSNETAKAIFPELNESKIDHPLGSAVAKELINPLLKQYKKDKDNNKHLVEREGRSYLISINALDAGFLNRGYQLLISDDTENQKRINLIKNYNAELEKEVKQKTKNIQKIQEKLVLGMATMVEGRDNSTGGHIRRTSDVVYFLVEEMKKDENLHLSEKFYDDVIKAAPMHDLGKITIDDVILRKPGKFTPEEYEIMKTHAEEGARIVKQILEGTNDEEFTKIAINVAHCHHERWDGTGYPHKLVGEEIPFEARIMAIADVYDALVSKRVYKERMPFDKANEIILDGMGKSFDKSLEKYYLAARPKIEEYYTNND